MKNANGTPTFFLAVFLLFHGSSLRLAIVSALSSGEAWNDPSGSSRNPWLKLNNQEDALVVVPSFSSLLALPIFPLRKSVRFPTDSLTLNLYEPRYLDMAEYILQENDGIFGALYISNKAHVVQENGCGPIVPLLQSGDVGTVFQVQFHEEAMIPTIGGEQRRRIRLESTGIMRFQIQSILQNGFSSSSSSSSSKMNRDSFILAEALCYSDDPISPDETENLAALIGNVCRNVWRHHQQQQVDWNEWSTTVNAGSSLLLRDHMMKNPTLADLETQTFAMASRLMKQSTTVKEKSAFLRSQCLKERIQKLADSERQQRRNPILSPSLFGWQRSKKQKQQLLCED
ncbi:hypothetical protein ACA910_014691 [Epithemia clementina (nom. ined.)]